jgi:hypothetical protein
MLPNGIGQFRFAGDLQFESNELVIRTGDAPISLFSLNDVSLGAGVTFDVSATNAQAGPGGGLGAGLAGASGSGGPGGAGAALSTPTEPLWSDGAPGAAGGVSNPVFLGCSIGGGFNAGTAAARRRGLCCEQALRHKTRLSQIIYMPQHSAFSAPPVSNSRFFLSLSRTRLHITVCHRS